MLCKLQKISFRFSLSFNGLLASFCYLVTSCSYLFLYYHVTVSEVATLMFQIQSIVCVSAATVTDWIRARGFMSTIRVKVTFILQSANHSRCSLSAKPSYSAVLDQQLIFDLETYIFRAIVRYTLRLTIQKAFAARVRYL